MPGEQAEENIQEQAVQQAELPEQNMVGPVNVHHQHAYMDVSGIKPPSFNWDSQDLPQEYKSFRRYCELLLSTPGYRSRTGPETVSYLLLWMGPQAV